MHAWVKKFLGAIALPRKRAGNSLYIGESISGLKKQRIISCTHNGRSMQVDSLLEWKWSKKRGSVGINVEGEPNPHMLITGMSGHGKSTLLEAIAEQLSSNGKNVLVFDVHNEHSGIGGGMARFVDAHYNSVNPLALDGMTVNQRISGIVSMLKSLYGLGHIQTTKLSQCLWYMYRKHGAMSQYSTEIQTSPTIAELVNEIGIFISNAKGATERNALLHLKAKISGLSKPSFIKDTISVRQLMGGLNIISLADIKSKEELYVYVTTILERVYYMMRSNSINNGVSTYIVIDEAQYLVGSSADSASMIRRLVEEGRKYGIAMVLATPSISSMDRRMMANMSTIMSFALREPTEVSYISKLVSSGMGTDRAIMSVLPRLGKGELLLTSSSVGPVLVKTARVMAKPRAPEAKAPLRDKTAALAIKPVRADELKSTVGSSVVKSMVASGELTAATSYTGRNAEEWVMKKSGAFTIEHELAVKRIAEFLTNAGLTNRIEDNANNPDIVAYRDGMIIAIEYETGSKSSASTMEMLERRKSGYDYVVVVTPGTKAHESKPKGSKD